MSNPVYLCSVRGNLSQWELLRDETSRCPALTTPARSVDQKGKAEGPVACVYKFQLVDRPSNCKPVKLRPGYM